MPQEMRAGFVALLGRPNVGKSTLVNSLVGAKVTITSKRPNTTRHGTRGILTLPTAQVVFVDSPGLHRPKTALGERLNETARSNSSDADLVLALVDASAPIGPGDRVVLDQAFLAHRRGGCSIFVVVNKVDRAKKDKILVQLADVAKVCSEYDGSDDVEFFPVSARTGEGIEELSDAIVAVLPEGPKFYPDDVLSDTPETVFVAELVREALLRRLRDELPHAIACRVTEWEWPHVRCEILVERDSQKAIVIGRGGEVLKEVGIAVRHQMEPGAYLELAVRVERRWQDRDDALDRLGY